MLRIGIDLGGTKMAGVTLDAAGLARAQARRATPRDYATTVAGLAWLVAELDRQAGPAASVGIGLPGLVAPQDGTVRRAVNLPWLEGRPLAADLAERTGRPVRLANDANCFVLSEALDGAAAGAEVVFGVVLGTGVGGGWVVRGRLLTGAHGLAGEWGHAPLPWRSPAEGEPVPCACGRVGCIETVLSGAGLARLYQALGGRAADGAEIARRVAQGEPAALAARDRYAGALAKALAAQINAVDPDVIVLGGGVSGLPGLIPAVIACWGAHALVAAPGTRLVRARFGADSGLRGAARLFGPG